MPLATYALYAQGIVVLVFSTSDTWMVSMRHFLLEGGCGVISTGTAIKGSDVPDEFPDRDKLFDNSEWINAGNAVVVQPMHKIVAGSLNKENVIL